MTRSPILLAASAVGALLFPVPAQAQSSNSAIAAERCSRLAGLRLTDTDIVSASFVAERATPTSAKEPAGHRAFCRVVARVRAAQDSDIGVEIWLPIDGWNGVFHGNGSGGFAGVFTTGYSGMVDGLRRGFATATTDTGTAPATPTEGDALIGHPRKWRDWARLSTHIMTVTGKAITKAFYGRDIRRAFYTGCSTGGQQGLIEALYYPTDYDGILVGAPVINRTWGHAAVLWDYAAAHGKGGAPLSESKLALLNRAAIGACARQGYALAGDRFVSDALQCRFDPAILQCRGADAETCLTIKEIATARAFYSGPTRANGKPLYHGWLPGSEVPGPYGWSFLQTPIKGQPPFSSLFKWVFGDNWDWRQFNFDRDMPIVDARLDSIVNDAMRGSLRAFARRGGKLIIFHGLEDTLVAPGQSVEFYNHHAAALGRGAIAKTARLFLAPGMMHCGGGNGPDSFNSTLGIAPLPPRDDAQHNLFRALIDWTEGGEAPEQVIATKFAPGGAGNIEMQRPLCAYPQRATHIRGTPTDAASSFSCASKSIAGSARSHPS